MSIDGIVQEHMADQGLILLSNKYMRLAFGQVDFFPPCHSLPVYQKLQPKSQAFTVAVNGEATTEQKAPRLQDKGSLDS